jgi:hypothetical protein
MDTAPPNVLSTSSHSGVQVPAALVRRVGVEVVPDAHRRVGEGPRRLLAGLLGEELIRPGGQDRRVQIFGRLHGDVGVGKRDVATFERGGHLRQVGQGFGDLHPRPRIAGVQPRPQPRPGGHRPLLPGRPLRVHHPDHPGHLRVQLTQHRPHLAQQVQLGGGRQLGRVHLGEGGDGGGQTGNPVHHATAARTHVLSLLWRKDHRKKSIYMLRSAKRAAFRC